jgi:hypothetical protein
LKADWMGQVNNSENPTLVLDLHIFFSFSSTFFLVASLKNNCTLSKEKISVKREDYNVIAKHRLAAH